MSQPVTAFWWEVYRTDGHVRDVHDKETALEWAETHTVKQVSNGSPDPRGRRTHGELQPDGTLTGAL